MTQPPTAQLLASRLARRHEELFAELTTVVAIPQSLANAVTRRNDLYHDLANDERRAHAAEERTNAIADELRDLAANKKRKWSMVIPAKAKALKFQEQQVERAHNSAREGHRLLTLVADGRRDSLCEQEEKISTLQAHLGRYNQLTGEIDEIHRAVFSGQADLCDEVLQPKLRDAAKEEKCAKDELALEEATMRQLRDAQKALESCLAEIKTAVNSAKKGPPPISPVMFAVPVAATIIDKDDEQVLALLKAQTHAKEFAVAFKTALSINSAVGSIGEIKVPKPTEQRQHVRGITEQNMAAVASGRMSSAYKAVVVLQQKFLGECTKSADRVRSLEARSRHAEAAMYALRHSIRERRKEIFESISS